MRILLTHNMRTPGPLLAVAWAIGFASLPMPADAQSGCNSIGYRVLARRWDAVLKAGWELRQDCAHPEWPARAVTSNSLVPPDVRSSGDSVPPIIPFIQPLLVHAGDTVRLWLQDSTVRIEMSGVAEQSARNGERVTVRITRISDEGSTVERIAGTVRGAGNVEMDR